MCCEIDLSGGSAKGSDGAADRLSRRRCLVGPVDFNLLALSLLREHIRAGRKGFHELAPLSSPQWKMLSGPQPKLVQTASMALQHIRC